MVRKTPEELAEKWCAEHTCHLQMTCHANAFLAGFQAGVKEAEIRILNEFFDNYGADEHASFALRVNAYQWSNENK